MPASYGAAPIEMDSRRASVRTGAALRGRSWGYSLGTRGVSRQVRAAREVTADVVFGDLATADALRRAADRDFADGSPGTLVVDGEWVQRALVAGFEPDVITRSKVTGSLKVLLLDGCWRRERVLSVAKRDQAAADGWLDLPTDHAYDLSSPPQSLAAESVAATPAAVRIVFWGPCTDPYIVVAGNRYQVDATVPAGARLEVDGHSWPKTVSLVSAAGDRTDLFAAAHRGTGEGGGEYCFQPLPAGRSEVSWPGSFGFDLYWYEEEGEPPWTRS